jgi:hypothetical protein
MPACRICARHDLRETLPCDRGTPKGLVAKRRPRLYFIVDRSAGDKRLLYQDRADP